MKEFVVSRSQNTAVADFGQGKFVVANLEEDALKVHFRDVNLPGKDSRILANSEGRYRSLYAYDFTPYEHVFMVMGRNRNLSAREMFWTCLSNTLLFDIFYENSLQNQEGLLEFRATALVYDFLHSINSDIQSHVNELNARLESKTF